jgi:exodeoxyribonuclease VII small subunit
MNDSPANDLTFEEALTALEQIVHDLEDGQIGLEDALSRYEKGVGLLKRCYLQLQQAEQRIQLLGVNAEGQAAFQPFETSGIADPSEVKKRQKKTSEGDNLF